MNSGPLYKTHLQLQHLLGTAVPNLQAPNFDPSANKTNKPIMRNDSSSKNPESLYQDGKQIHNHSKDPGYQMNPKSQGLHGKGKASANKFRALRMDNMGNKWFSNRRNLWIAAGSLLAAGAGFAGWKWATKRGGFFSTPSTNGKM